ncbi:zf-HC2 domain-containing protein [Paenibacillus elgii]|uniref:zf-HC2 domain-containing protein n=1 Tax=Paenibacillus elgii TaxID=189691 RepID=UPI000248C50D|nr:zf-HC2 domain-containing protein [Paenibacillus elgii]
MNTCSIVKDLMPLHVEGLASEESAALVERHIAVCEECRRYYETMKTDYENHEQSRPEPDKKRQIEELIAQLGKYQRRIKLVSVLVAMLMTCIISGAEVHFLSTIPFLILTPFVCRLYYSRTLPIVASTIPFGLLGGLLSENNSSYIPFFTIIALVNAAVGVGAALLVKQGLRQAKMAAKAGFMALGAAILYFGCAGYFSFWGNPVGYTKALLQTNDYVNRTYEQGTLDFKKVFFSFKDKRHYGEFEFVMNGVRQTASIGFYRDGSVTDEYKFKLDNQFGEERSDDLKIAIAAAVDPVPSLTVEASPQAKLEITKDELDANFHYLSPDKLDKAEKLRASESGKLRYEILFGASDARYEKLTKESFLAKSAAVLRTLQERKLNYHSVEMKAMDPSGNIQTVELTKLTTEQDLPGSYRAFDPERQKDQP